MTNVALFTFIKSNSLDEILSGVLAYNPAKLYLVIDPVSNEADLVHQQKIKEIVFGYQTKINIQFIKPETHLGIAKIFDFAMEQIFNSEDQIIILEDDTIPSSSFFDFCNVGLNKYKNDETVGSIMGANLLEGNTEIGFFKSNFGFPYWGWATWKNRWINMPKDDNFFEYTASENSKLNEILQTFIGTKGINVSWDVRWCIYQYMKGMDVVVPSVNLISNRGFNEMATFTKNGQSMFSNLPNASNLSSVDWNTENEIKELYLSYINRVHFFLNEFKNNS
jgi:hypothetical protein